VLLFSVDRCRLIFEIVNVTESDIELNNAVPQHQLSCADSVTTENSLETNDSHMLTVKGGHTIR